MKKAYFLPRALILFAAFLAIGVGFLRFSNHHYKNVANWGDPTSTEVILYEEDTFYLAGQVGDEGMSSNKFPKNELLGEIKPGSFFDTTSPLLVWNVEGKANYLIVIDEDNKEWLYYREGAINPAAPETVTE